MDESRRATAEENGRQTEARCKEPGAGIAARPLLAGDFASWVSSAVPQRRQRNFSAKEAERHEHDEQRTDDPGRCRERQVEPTATDADHKAEKEAAERGDHDLASLDCPEDSPWSGFDSGARCLASRSVTT